MTSRKYPLPEEERLSEIVKFRVTSDEKESLRETAKRMGFDGISEFVRFWIMDLVKTKGSGVDAVSTIGQTATAGTARLGFEPIVTIENAETGEQVWVSEPADVE